ncbi:Holliday junction branch migration protein RuvA [Spiroplasma eriocheiris]|uniref:Holliday junction branch migration complex subunit RuvA n=1 Tax=Spiroplasma eriocheiris TaxID=315358 RepID=A0A0H3XI19_9MOLU|nr:Holliday junction branch migration protein RuvA [Spiroplasma eriocheiris]AKM54080.1 Holliday junction DNA helicase RuvA [Spiroplasma eriocheiris]
MIKMYSYLKGIVRQIKDHQILLEINNYGYEITLITPKEISLHEQDLLQVYTCLINNEFAAYQWFGFYNLETKKLFLDLLTIPTIGLKTAYNVLTQVGVDQLLSYVKENNIETLSKLKGIKSHTARILIMHLQKIYFRKEYNNLQNSVIDCLKTLGYSLPIIYKAINESNHHCDNLDQYLKQVLQKASSYVYL